MIAAWLDNDGRMAGPTTLAMRERRLADTVKNRWDALWPPSLHACCRSLEKISSGCGLREPCVAIANEARGAARPLVLVLVLVLVNVHPTRIDRSELVGECDLPPLPHTTAATRHHPLPLRIHFGVGPARVAKIKHHTVLRPKTYQHAPCILKLSS